MPSVYFYCAPYVKPEAAAYQHLTVCLAEGLRALGVAVYSNIDYWKTANGFLLTHDPNVAASDCDAIAIGDAWFDSGRPMPEEIVRQGRDYRTTYLDAQDGSNLYSHDPRWRAFDLVLRTHFVDDRSNGANFAPWTFGLSDRILRMTDAPPIARNRTVLFNFRHQRFPHSVRLAAERRIAPGLARSFRIDATVDPPSQSLSDADRLSWEQTGRRHSPAYFTRLQNAMACGAFGGYFIAPWPRSSAGAPARALKRIITKSGFATHRIVQWDSWRLWEAFASGTAALHVDFARYACRFPVAPVNWVHYAGFDLSAPHRAIERIADDPALLERIGRAGRAWALEHYGPIPTARRFLLATGLDEGPSNARR